MLLIGLRERCHYSIISYFCVLIFSLQPKRRMNSEYFFQLDRRDEFIGLAKKAMGENTSAKGVEVFEKRETDYSRFQNAFNTYRIPETNPYLEKIKAAENK